MLKDSQHIGHSRPSSLLVHEDASSSEQLALEEVQFGGLFFPKPDAQALDAKLHICVAQIVNYLKDPDFAHVEILLGDRPEITKKTMCEDNETTKRNQYPKKNNMNLADISISEKVEDGKL